MSGSRRLTPPPLSRQAGIGEVQATSQPNPASQRVPSIQRGSLVRSLGELASAAALVLRKTLHVKNSVRDLNNRKLAEVPIICNG